MCISRTVNYSTLYHSSSDKILSISLLLSSRQYLLLSIIVPWKAAVDNAMAHPLPTNLEVGTSESKLRSLRDQNEKLAIALRINIEMIDSIPPPLPLPLPGPPEPKPEAPLHLRPPSDASDFHHPYTPYNIQVDFMRDLYSVIEDGKVAVFESPTGTVCIRTSSKEIWRLN